MSDFSGIVIQGVHPNNGVMISCYSKGLEDHTRTQTKAQWNSCSSPSCWKHCLSYVGSSQHCDSISSDLKALLQRRASTHHNEQIAFQHNFRLSLWIIHHTETSNQSFNKDDNDNSGYPWPVATSAHTPISSSHYLTRRLLAHPFYR